MIADMIPVDATFPVIPLIPHFIHLTNVKNVITLHVDVNQVVIVVDMIPVVVNQDVIDVVIIHVNVIHLHMTIHMIILLVIIVITIPVVVERKRRNHHVQNHKNLVPLDPPDLLALPDRLEIVGQLGQNVQVIQV